MTEERCEVLDSLLKCLRVALHLLQNHLHGRVGQDLLHFRVRHGALANHFRVLRVFRHGATVALHGFLSSGSNHQITELYDLLTRLTSN